METLSTMLTFQPGPGASTRRELVFERARARSATTLEQYANRWLALARGRKPRTMKEYRYRLERHVFPALGSKPLAEVGAPDVLGLFRALEDKGYSGWTVHSVALILKVVFRHAVINGELQSSPFERMERGDYRPPGRTPRRILNAYEIGALLRETAPDHQLLLTTALFTGLRQGELLGLQWEHVDAVAKVIHVRTALDRNRQHVPPKTPASVRDVVLPERLLDALTEARRCGRYGGRSDYVFPTRVGTAQHWRNVSRRILQPARVNADIGAFRWHDMRHTYASILISRGANLLFVSRQLGHAAPEHTLRLYGDLFEKEQQGARAREALEEFMPMV